MDSSLAVFDKESLTSVQPGASECVIQSITANKKDLIISCLLFTFQLFITCFQRVFSQNILDFTTLRKHAYLNIMKISSPKTERFLIKILIFFIFLLKT